jgi:hypothetical protein
VSFVETDELPLLDFKLRNSGKEVAFIKRAEIRVEQNWTLHWPTAGGAAPPSWNYDLVLPTTGAPYVASVDLSQTVDPNGVDRFTITVSPDEHITPFADYIYSMEVKLIYDEDNKEVSTGPLVYMVGYPKWFNKLERPSGELPSTVPGSWKQQYDENREIAEEISKVEGKRNERLEALLASS